MNSNILRHRLLGILTSQYFSCENGETHVVGVSFDDITLELKCTDKFLRQSISELYNNKEIGYHKIEGAAGIHATELGVASYSSKKYRLLYCANIKNNISYWFQIIVPILSLLIALVAVIHDFKGYNEKTNTQIPAIKSQLELIQSDIEKLKFQYRDSL